MSWRTSSGRLSNWSEWLPDRSSSSIALFFWCVVEFIFLWFLSQFFMWGIPLAKNPRQGTFTSSSWQYDQLIKFGGLSDHTGFQVLPHMVSGNFLSSTLRWSLAESISLSCLYRFLHVGEIINFAVDLQWAPKLNQSCEITIAEALATEPLEVYRYHEIWPYDQLFFQITHGLFFPHAVWWIFMWSTLRWTFSKLRN